MKEVEKKKHCGYSSESDEQAMNASTRGLWVPSRKTVKQIGNIYSKLRLKTNSSFMRIFIAGLSTAEHSKNVNRNFS